MTSLSHTILFLWLLGLSLVVVGQETSTSKLPVCAQKCLLGAFSTNTCSPTDQACICTNEKFQANVTLCVAVSCSIPQALTTQNISLATCGSPVRNRGHNYVVISNVMVSIAAVFVVGRFAFKIIVTNNSIGYDDWSVLATLICSSASAIITVYGTVKNGLGQDIWTLRPEQITKMLEYFYVMAVLYFTEITFIKLSLTFFYIRVFPSSGVQKLLWGTVVFVTLWGVAYVLTAVFQCQPISYFWTHWDGLHRGSCVDINAITESHAGLSIALDFWILGIPLWQIWGLKLHWKKKVGVALMFCVGTFVTVVSILRLQALVHFAASSNTSWEFYDVSVWSSIEICVGMMCACLPTLRLILVKLFPILSGSSARSRHNYHNYGSGNELKELPPSNRSRNTDAATLSTCHSPRLEALTHEENITVKKPHTVQHNHSDTDEASLVSHEKKREP